MNDLALGVHHQLRNGWRTSRAFTVAAVSGSAFVHGLAIMAAALHEQVSTAGVTAASVLPLVGGLWLALAVLPALGGADTDDPVALAAAGAGRTFRFGARFAAAVTDAGPGFFVPALALVGAAAAGWPGWAAGLALAWSGVAVGQLASAASVILAARAGVTAALLTAAALVLAAGTAQAAGSAGPGAWWQAATRSAGVLVALLAAGFAALLAAWLLNRPNEAAAEGNRAMRMPRAGTLALIAATQAGVARSVMGRSALVSAVLAPLLASGAGQQVTSSIAFFVTAAAAAMIGSNGFAYDGGGVVWLLGKTSRWQLLLARFTTTTTWALLLAALAAAGSAVVGAPLALGLAPRVVVAALGAAAAGLVPSVARPTPTDVSSLRAQPAPVASAVGALARSAVLAGLALLAPLPVAAAVVAGYVVVAAVHARWLLRDPVGLSALT